MPETTFTGVIFCYHRAGRGNASRALKRAGLSDVEYLSQKRLRWDGDEDPKPTPRYLFYCATAAQVDALSAELRRDGEGTELYFNKEG